MIRFIGEVDFIGLCKKDVYNPKTRSYEKSDSEKEYKLTLKVSQVTIQEGDSYDNYDINDYLKEILEGNKDKLYLKSNYQPTLYIKDNNKWALFDKKLTKGSKVALYFASDHNKEIKYIPAVYIMEYKEHEAFNPDSFDEPLPFA